MEMPPRASRCMITDCTIKKDYLRDVRAQVILEMKENKGAVLVYYIPVEKKRKRRGAGFVCLSLLATSTTLLLYEYLVFPVLIILILTSTKFSDKDPTLAGLGG